MTEKDSSSLGRLRTVWPDIRALLRPRRALLAWGLLLMAVNRVSGLVLPASPKWLVDDVLGKRQTQLLAPLLGLVVLATLVQGITSFSLTQLLSKAAQRLIAELRQKVQVHIGRLPVSYFDSNKTGTLVARIMTDVEGIRNLIGTGLVEFVGGLLTALLAFLVLLRLSASMTLMAFGCLVLFSFGLKWAFKTIRPIFRERSKINAEVAGRLTESLSGVRVVKGYQAEGQEEGVFRGGVSRLLRNILRTLTATSLMSLASTMLLGIVGALIMYLGTRRILAGTMTLGGFFTYSMFLGFLVAPIFQVVNIGTQIAEALAGLERMHEVMAEPREDLDPGRTLALSEVRGLIRFDQVHFAYEANKPVLDDVSFAAEPGTVTALVGSSGSGKSTITGLIAGFYKPSSGRILIDSADLAQVRLDSYRQSLGVVLQESFLFDGTIRENVAFSRPSSSAEEVLRVCRIARVDEFAERFPDGYDTVVGERGVKLSGGQRQRISIARALLANPRILILDEATSSLDSESEALIQEGLSHLMSGRTTFVIAHRLSTIRRADQILVVEAGKIVERGTHEELYRARGRYQELYAKQQGLDRNLLLAPGEGDPVVEEPPAPPLAKEPEIPSPINPVPRTMS